MKLGLNTAILGELGFEEMIDFVSDCGLDCVEVCCWPGGSAGRRYAGVTHIDVEGIREETCRSVRAYCDDRDVEISALAYYPNTLDPDEGKRAVYIRHLKNVIDASAKLGVGMVTTFIGRDGKKTVEENLETVKAVWPAILKFAEERGVKIAIENCPMLFTNDEWPGGQNLMTSPAIWRKVFEILPSDYLGINYDPSHFVWQQMDYIRPLYEFRDKIFHVHYKDIRVYRDKLDDVGIMATPLQYMSPKLPGLGDVDWGSYVSALLDIGYQGFGCIEVEDKSFEGSVGEKKKAVRLSTEYLRNFVI